MREIKFRIVYNNKILGYEKIVDGDWQWMCPELNPDGGERWTNGSFPSTAENHYKTIRQLYTGYVDKNLQEIYDGDKLESDNRQIYKVVWIEQMAGFYLSIPNTHRGKEFISCAASQSDGPMTLHTHELLATQQG